MSFLVSILAAWSVVWMAAGAAMSPVTVLHCCPPDQALTDDALRAAVLSPEAVATACGPVVGNATRTIRIYSLQKKLITTEVPHHWKNQTGVPNCKSLRLLPEHAVPYVLRGTDGVMMVRGARNLHPPPTRYCMDVKAAFVCADDLMWEPAKCCAEEDAFDGKQCVKQSVRAQEALHELKALIYSSAAGSASTVGHGWPTCPLDSRYAVVGTLAGAQLTARGGLMLSAAGGGGEALAGGAWCAEAVLGEAGVRVLACEAATRSRGAQSSRLAVGAAFLVATLAASFY